MLPIGVVRQAKLQSANSRQPIFVRDSVAFNSYLTRATLEYKMGGTYGKSLYMIEYWYYVRFVGLCSKRQEWQCLSFNVLVDD
jgi:hypothetical protein